MENFNPTEKRASLFSHLDYAIGLSREKSSKEKALNEDRQRWLRIMISAVEAYGKLLETVELGEFEERLSRLEEPKQETQSLSLSQEDILTRLRRLTLGEETEARRQQETRTLEGNLEAPTQIS